jgi:hypothetical protein
MESAAGDGDLLRATGSGCWRRLMESAAGDRMLQDQFVVSANYEEQPPALGTLLLLRLSMLALHLLNQLQMYDTAIALFSIEMPC